jgi:hypothetical protein
VYRPRAKEPRGDAFALDKYPNWMPGPGPWLGTNTEGTAFPTYLQLTIAAAIIHGVSAFLFCDMWVRRPPPA